MGAWGKRELDVKAPAKVSWLAVSYQDEEVGGSET